MDLEQAMDMLLYFWTEKGDVTRYTKWGELEFMDMLRRERPEVIVAVEQLRVAERTLTAVLEAG